MKQFVLTIAGINMRFNSIIIISILLGSSLFSQEWDYKYKHLFAVGQKDTEINTIRIVNTSENTWSMSTKISISLPKEFPAEWIHSSAQISVKHGSNTQLITKGLQAFDIHNDRQSISIVNTPRVQPGDILIIKGLMLGNFTTECNYGRLVVYLNGKAGNQVRNVNVLHKLQKLRKSYHLAEKLFPIFLFNAMKKDIIDDSKMISYFDTGLFAIMKVDLKLSEPITLPIGSKQNFIPAISIINGTIHKLNPINNILSLEFPFPVISASDNINIYPKKYIKDYSIDGSQLNIILKRALPANQVLTVHGIIISVPRSINKSSYPINYAWTNLRRTDRVKLQSPSRILFGDITIEMSSNVELVANSGTVTVSEIKLIDDAELPVLKRGSFIVITIPDKVLVFWNKKQLKAQLSGRAASKVENTLNFDGNKKVRLKVIEDFQTADELLINGLSVYARRRNSEDIKRGKILNKPASIKMGKNKNYVVKTLDKTIQIIEIDMTMDGDQIILENDDYEDLQNIKIALESEFAAFKPGDRLRVQISEQLNAEWSIGIDKAKITGTTARKIDPKIKIDSRYPNAIILVVIDNIEGQEEFNISGLGLESIGSTSHSGINLYLNDADKPIASTDNEVLIRNPILAMSDDQIVFKEDEITDLFAIELNINGLANYFTEGNYFDLIIPENSPIQFNTDKVFSAGMDMSLKNEIKYIDEKTARFTVRSNLGPGAIINITGLEIAQPTNFSAGTDTLYLSVDGRPSIKCRNSYEVVSKSSEFKRSEYYFKLIESNMREGENLVLELDGNLVWDRSRTSIKYNPITAKGMIEFRKPEYSEDYKSISLKITESFGEEDIFRLSGLAVTYNDFALDAYVKLKYKNLYGEESAVLRYPISYLGKKPVLPRVVPRFLTESYTKPLIRLMGEGSGSVPKNKLIQTMNAAGNKYFSLPELVIQNGELTGEDNSIYKEYISYLSNLESRIRTKRYTKAEQFAEKLIRLSPKTWIGYYYKAVIFKEQNERLSDSRELYQQAIQLGYIASEDYPVIYQDDINSQAWAYIAEARQLINNSEFIDAEKRLNTVLSMPDSLNPVNKGDANFLLGEIALKLNDCDWAARYFENSFQTGVSDQDVYSFRQASTRLTDCRENNSFTAIESEYVSILPPLLDFRLDNKEMQMSFTSNINYPNTIGIYNRLEGQNAEPLGMNNYTLKDNSIYRLNVKPIRVQIIALGTIIGISGLLVGSAL